MSNTAKPAAKKPESAEPEAKPEPAARLGSKINNAPVVVNTGGYELKVAPIKPEKIGMAGHNTGGYELRVSQEQGTH
jgi:hypothetical protein